MYPLLIEELEKIATATSDLPSEVASALEASLGYCSNTSEKLSVIQEIDWEDLSNRLRSAYISLEHPSTEAYCQISDKIKHLVPTYDPEAILL
mgnify:CR=1 FL=1|tara:strand:- start:212 stop:490 length:279 start_codon:yes stop_codon:yes gene_type:complete